MVSFENGRFILRRRQQPSPQHRLLLRLFPTIKIVIFAAIVIIWGYLISKATDTVVDQDMLRASRDADIPTVVEAARRVVDTPKNQLLQHRQEDDHDKSAPLHVLHTFEADQNIEGGGEDEEKSGSKEEDEGSFDELENNEEEGSGDGEEEDEESGDEPRNKSEGKPVDYSIQLNKEFMEHLQSLDSIPKIIHMFFPDKLYYKKEPILPFVSHSIISLINLNRDWNVTVYDDAMVDSVIKNAGDQGIISKEEVDVLIGEEGGDQEGPKQTAHIVERTDIARLLLMYTEGGVYLDVDRLVSKRFDDIFTPSTRLCLPTHFDINFAQDIMCSSRLNELFLSLVQEASKIRMKSERRKGWIKAGTLYDMGPDLYNKQILMKVFGMDSKAYDSHKEDKNFFVQAREAIAVSNGTIITKKESDYCENTLVLDDTILGCPGREELYERYSMTPWSEEVDAVWDTEN